MKNSILTTAALAGILFLGQGAFAQQSNDAPASSSQDQSQSRSQSGSQAGSQSDRSSSGSSDSATPAGARGQQGRGLSSRGQGSQNMDQKFVECASASNQFEIQAAQLAEQQAQDEQVKQFAKQLRQDHEQSSKQLQQIAQQANITISKQLKPPQQAMLQELKQMQGEEFDKAYVYGNVAGHSIAVLTFRDASQRAQNPQLKQFAQQTLPKLQQHLQHAQQLAQWDEASAQTAGSRIPAAGDRTGTNRSDSPSGAGSFDRSTPRDAGGTTPGRTGTGTGTSDPNRPGSTSNQQRGTNDTGAGATSDSASGGRNPSR